MQVKNYECEKCHGICDPGELEGSVCFECRSGVSAAIGRESFAGMGRSKPVHIKYAERCGGQLAMELG